MTCYERLTLEDLAKNASKLSLQFPNDIDFKFSAAEAEIAVDRHMLTCPVCMDAARQRKAS